MEGGSSLSGLLILKANGFLSAVHRWITARTKNKMLKAHQPTGPADREQRKQKRFPQ